MKKLHLLISFFVVFSLVFSQEKITFNSANPFSFQDIIKNLDSLFYLNYKSLNQGLVFEN